MSKTDRSVLISNDQNFGQVADPDKIEVMVKHAYDKIDENVDELNTYKGQVTQEINQAVTNASNSNIVATGTAFPENPSEGHEFYHKTNNKLYIYSSGQWVPQKEDVLPIVKEELEPINKQLANLNLQLEVSNRVPGSDAIGSTGSPSTAIGITEKRKYAKAVNPLSIGANVFTVDSVTDLAINEEYTIFDDVNLERIKFTAIDTPSKAVTLTTGLTKAFKANANIVKSSTINIEYEGFHLAFWENPTVAQSMTTYNPGMSINSNNYTYAVHNSGVVMDNGEVFFIQVDSINNGSPIIRINKIVDNTKSAFMEIPIVNTASTYAMGLLNLGGYFLGVYYYSGDQLNFRIINTYTGEYVINTITTRYDYNGDWDITTACVSKDRKTVHMLLGGRLYIRVRIKPNMTITYELQDYATFNSIYTNANIVVQGSYVCIVGVNGASAVVMYYRLAEANMQTAWSYNSNVYTSFNGTSSYTPVSLAVLVDSNDCMWIGFDGYYSGGGSTVKNMYAYATSVNSWSSIMDLNTTTYIGHVEVAEVGNDVCFFVSENGSSSNSMAIQTIPINKSTKVKGTPAATGVVSSSVMAAPNASLYSCWRVLKTYGNISAGTVPLLAITGSNPYTLTVSLPSQSTTFTTKRWYPVLVTDTRFSLSNVKELTLYVYTQASSITVKGFVDGVEMTRTVSGTETVLDFVSPTLKPTAEIRLEFTRDTTANKNRVTKILGGVSAD